LIRRKRYRISANIGISRFHHHPFRAGPSAGPARGESALAGIPLYALMKLPADSRPEPAAAALRADRLELAVPSEARDHA